LGVRFAALVALVGVAALWPGGPPARATAVTGVSAGDAHTCVLASSVVSCWGDNSFGNLGLGTMDSQGHPNPQAVPALAGDAAAVSVGGLHSCAITLSSGVKCWGRNQRGQLGDGTFTQRLVPVDALGLGSGVAAVAAGGDHTCVLTGGGAVKCFGRNQEGQIGDNGVCGANCPTPIDVSGLSAGVAAITSGRKHSCALLTSGGVKCWGDNSNGQLGDGQACGDLICRTPADVAGLESDAIAVSAGGNHTCAVVQDEPPPAAPIAVCWGDNALGQLGDDGAPADRLSPVPVCADAACMGPLAASGVAAGGAHTCATTAAGATKCWGYNHAGQLGDGTSDPTIPATTPVDVLDLVAGVTLLDAGDGHACALAPAGLMCWGHNGDGRLGFVSTELCGSFMDIPCSTHPVPSDMDGDLDGCLDEQESGTNPAQGGMRDPKSLWDFFDVPTGAGLFRDQAVSAADIAAVAARFGANDATPGDFYRDGNPYSRPNAPVMPPGARANYHPIYDRGGPAPGGAVWDLLPPDGTISAGDIAAVVNQFGHSCA
jgi:hypothetical protein